MLFAKSSISWLSTPSLTFASGVRMFNGLSASLGSSGNPEYSPVSMGPGATAFTVARSASSRAHTRVMASKAPFVPAYEVCHQTPHVVVALEILTMRPERSVGRYGNAALISSAGALQFRLNVASNSSRSSSSMDCALTVAALLTMMSIWKRPEPSVK